MNGNFPFAETFQSPLPGGNKNSIGSSKSPAFCLLDCIFVEHQYVFIFKVMNQLPTLPHNIPYRLTYYVLDMMCWSGYQYFDCEAEFRFQWKAVKFQEDEVWGWYTSYRCRMRCSCFT